MKKILFTVMFLALVCIATMAAPSTPTVPIKQQPIGAEYIRLSNGIMILIRK